MDGGKWYIPGPDEEELIELYVSALDAGTNKLSMIEYPRDILPVLIDLDFRFPIEKTSRQYTTEMIKDIVKVYVYELGKYVDLTGINDITIMEKATPIVDAKHNRVKDGIHIMMPDIVTNKHVQLEVRKNVLPELAKVLAPLNCTNPIEDIVDEAVIGTNGWLMYGSQKPDNIPYKVTHHWDLC